MKVFKFGGASVKDSDGVRNLRQILQSYTGEGLVVVISAMGKTTNALEKVVAAYVAGEDWQNPLEEVKEFHREIVRGLTDTAENGMGRRLTDLFAELEEKLRRPSSEIYDYEYDQVIGYGELLSTRIVSEYLNTSGLKCTWVDARQLVQTDATWRNAAVDWNYTERLIQAKWNSLEPQERILICQGFIGHEPGGATTSLGREGSDYSAAIFAYCLNASDVTIWKDVPGMLNADPRYFSDARMIDQISFTEAIELAYYGASVIHPKTIKPLENKEIPLYVKSFIDPKGSGTLIQKHSFSDGLIPSFILKPEQILISITPQDFSFITEEDLQQIFQLFVVHKLQINLMQNSAINFSVCLDYDARKFEELLSALSATYRVRYNYPCQLVTIRHYNAEVVARLSKGKLMLLDQRSRETARLVLAEN